MFVLLGMRTCALARRECVVCVDPPRQVSGHVEGHDVRLYGSIFSRQVHEGGAKAIPVARTPNDVLSRRRWAFVIVFGLHGCLTMEALRKAKLRFARLRVHWDRFANSPRGEWILWTLRQVLTAIVVGYLIYQMATIGWNEIWRSMPRTPWFYVIFVGMYFTLPIFQALIFALIWGRSPFELFPPTLKKRVYNKDVLSYSGDVYLYFWARDRVRDWTDRELVHAIKDNAIISSVASTIVAFGLLAGFLFSGYVALPDSIAQNEILYLIGSLIVIAILIAVGVNFRALVFGLPGRILAAVFGLHIARLLTVMTLQILEWDVVVPEVDLEIWFTFLSLQIITGRIPFLPSRDLIFMAAGLELAGAVQVSKAAIAGVLGVHSVLDKTLNLIHFAAVSAWDRKTLEALSEMEDEMEADGTDPEAMLDADGESERPPDADSSAPSSDAGTAAPEKDG